MYGLSRQFGAEQAVGKGAMFTVLGVGARAVFVVRNTAIEQKLQAAG